MTAAAGMLLARLMQQGGEAEVHTEESFLFLSVPPPWVIGLVLVPATIAFAWWCYGGLARLEPGRRAVLATLRGLAIALCLLLVFQPAIERTRYSKVQNQVHVLVDDSASMKRKDSWPDEQARAALAEAGGVSDVSRHTRAELVEKVLERRGGLLEQLRETHEVRLFRFARKPLPIADLGEVAARGPRTHIGDALDLHLATSGSLNLDAVLLVSDGRNNTGLDPVEVADKYRIQDIPIHTIGAGDPAAPANAWIVGPPGPKEALRQEEVAFEVTVRAEGMAGERAAVSLHGAVDGGPYRSLASTPVTFGEEGTAVKARLYHAFQQAGDWSLRFDLQELPQESSHEDNHDVRFLHVEDERIRVLFLDERPRWSYRYIKNGLLRVDPSIEVQVYLFDASPVFTHERTEGLRPIDSIPSSREELLRYHVVLIGDVPPERLGPTEETIHRWLSWLVEFVELGGGAGFIYGEEAMPERYRGTPLEDLLPVVLEAPRELQQNPPDWSQPYRPILDNPEVPHDVLMLKRDPEENAHLWQRGFRPLYAWHKVLRAKPGATVLLRHPTERNRYGNLVIAAASHYPRGRTFYMGTDETWRWRDPYGEKYQDTFWRNVVRYLAGGRLARRDAHVELNVDKVLAETGERIRVSLLVHDEDFHPSVAEEQTLFLRRAEGELERRTLRAVTGEPGNYRGTLTFDEPGAVSLLVHRGGNPADEVLAREDVLIKIPDREMAHTSQDIDTLRRIAGASADGSYVMLADAGELASSFRDRRQLNTPLETTTLPLWDNGWSLVALLVVLGAEWLLRKRARLV